MPVLNGTNHDEERIFVSIGLTVSQGTDVPIPETPVTPGNYQANIAAALGVTAARAAQIAAEYPPGNDKASATVAFSALAGGRQLRLPSAANRPADLAAGAGLRLRVQTTTTRRRTSPGRCSHRPWRRTNPNSCTCSTCPTRTSPPPLDPGQQALAASMQAAWAYLPRPASSGM